MESNKTQARLKRVASDLSEDDLEILNVIADLIRLANRKRELGGMPIVAESIIFDAGPCDQCHRMAA